MERAVEGGKALKAHFRAGVHDWVRTPNTAPLGDPAASRAAQHGAFDDDRHTVQATPARVLGAEAAPAKVAFEFEPSASSFRGRRERAQVASNA